MIDLEMLIKKRIEAILRNDASLYTEYEVIKNDGMDIGVIAVMDENDLVQRCEFIESEISWMRPEAVDEYNDVADRGIPVSVIVPNEAFLAMSKMVQKYGDHDIAVFGYDSVLIRVKGLPP